MTQDEDYQARLDEQRQWLAYVRAGGAPPAPDGREYEDSVGTSGEGAVRAVVRDRRIFAVTVDQDALHQPAGAVSALLREAINPALAQSRIDTPAAGDPGPDLGAVGAQLSEFALQGGQALNRVQELLNASMAQLSGKTGLNGDSSPQYVDHLLQDALDVVRSTQAALSTDPAPPVTGEGRDEAEEVLATVTDGSVTELELTTAAVRLSPADLGQAVLEAVNTALEEWEERAGATERSGLDLEALQRIGARAEQVREQSLDHLRSYTTSLTTIMRNID
ncbi:hypothetical protein KCV87_01450 [Actinosynnema pretiosum subsp. pretiosum]|uniref:Uncharacterized protein n=2 Tax=Actinosynnema TaxID=40566 RepID=C6WD37_ACTMD|nr:hypothetical protein [Actinosynnema mirum]ACU37656.1 hypothetical protein Amir_3774 [Actinosynnema mirum DSM 43827]AXX31084.1 hypothetical protein APASM_3719 [Actinosynnema pretiosum subsp. pretiosum]QUF04832.1 hypothetical protein KCV87_01450 [Actinosynnema pretiosum subsp. pretiosum]